MVLLGQYRACFSCEMTARIVRGTEHLVGSPQLSHCKRLTYGDPWAEKGGRGPRPFAEVV